MNVHDLKSQLLTTFIHFHHEDGAQFGWEDVEHVFYVITRKMLSKSGREQEP